MNSLKISLNDMICSQVWISGFGGRIKIGYASDDPYTEGGLNYPTLKQFVKALNAALDEASTATKIDYEFEGFRIEELGLAIAVLIETQLDMEPVLLDFGFAPMIPWLPTNKYEHGIRYYYMPCPAMVEQARLLLPWAEGKEEKK